MFFPMPSRRFAGLCAGLGALIAGTADAAAPFTIEKANNAIAVKWRNQDFIVGENFTGGLDRGAAGLKKIGPDAVWNIAGQNNTVQYRREIATAKNNQELELSFQAQFPSYTTPNAGQQHSYSFELPFKLFSGAKYTAVIGRNHNPKTVTGTVPANFAQNKNLLGDRFRQIAFELPNQQRLVIDGNPGGVTDYYSDYTLGSVCGLWTVTRSGENLKFILGTTPDATGGVMSGKVKFYEGGAADYLQRHAVKSYSYFSTLPSERLFAFGASTVGKEYTPIQSTAFDAAKGFGWLNPVAITADQLHRSGALYGALTSTQANSFKFSGLRRGLYLFTIQTAAGALPAGPMQMELNGETVVTQFSVPPRTVRQICFARWVENGVAELNLSGNWRISTLGAQQLLASDEDMSFRRGFWRDGGLDTPSVMLNNTLYSREVAMPVALSEYPLPEPGKSMAATRRNLTRETGHAVFAPGKDWRYNPMIGSWGPGNYGTFTEYSSAADIARRLKELQQNGIDIIMFNGMLTRHTFPAHLERVDRLQSAVVQAGKPAGCHFIDHLDYSMLWNTDAGFRVLCENPAVTQREVGNALPNRAICPVNPAARENFYRTMAEKVRKTDVDALMIDEACFAGAKFCGCAFCRKKFTADTQWVLPADETSPELFNMQSPLWRVWLDWRRHQIGEFWLGLRRELTAIKKDIVFIGYSTHYGMYGNWATNDLGFDIGQAARTWDMIGTEIMTRNIFANSRAVNSLRKAHNQYRNVYGAPTFGLVYGNSQAMRYFGWALNNLNGQGTWETSSVRDGVSTKDYHNFAQSAGNMDFHTLVAPAKVALLFSNYSRECNKGSNFHAEILGISQTLTRMQINHEFIFEAGLTEEILKKFQVLIVGNSPSLAAENIAAIKAFVQQGGTAYLSYMTARYDEIANPRDKFAFADVLPIVPRYDSNRRRGTSLLKGTELVAKADVPLNAMHCWYPKAGTGTTVFELEDNAHQRWPGLFEIPCGKGRFLYASALFGEPLYAGELRVGAKVTFELPRGNEAVLEAILNYFIPKDGVWNPVKVPKGVISSVLESADKVYVNFLNAVDSDLKKGETISGKIPDHAFSVRPDDIVFRINKAGLSGKAEAFSPDFEGGKTLECRAMDDGTYEVVLPGNLLKVYVIVHLEKLK